MNWHNGGVYVITCDEDGLCYVGAALRFEERWRRHLRDLEAGLHCSAILQRAFDEGGPEALSFSILEIVAPRAGWLCIRDVYPAERRWMSVLRAEGRLCNGPQ